jgi:hypothetical protein
MSDELIALSVMEAVVEAPVEAIDLTANANGKIAVETGKRITGNREAARGLS